jgi:hypothetical protein
VCSESIGPDIGAVWDGCFAPFPRQSVSCEEFLAHFGDFPPDCFNYFFRHGQSGMRMRMMMRMMMMMVVGLAWIADMGFRGC